MQKHVIVFLVLMCLCLRAWSEEIPEIVAQVGDERITKRDLGDELAQMTGRDVLDNLIQERLILQEMARRKVTIPDDAVEARMKALDFRVQRRTEGGLDLERLLQKRGASVESQKNGVRLLLAMEAMAKQDFGMHPMEPISNLKVAKWLSSLRNKAKIVGRTGDLPKGVYASVNGEFVSEKQFYDLLFLNALPSELQFALERIISRKLVDQELNKRNEDVTASDIDTELAKMEEVIQRNPANRRMKLDDVLRLQSTSSHELRNDPYFRMRVAAKKLIRKEITPAEAKAFCEDHKALYGNGKVRASQIFISILDPKTRAARSETAQQDALRKITELQAQLGKGADFAELAKKYSDDSLTKNKGGDLGFFPRYGPVQDPMAGAAFLLRKGEMSGILSSFYGLYLIKTTDVEEPASVDFEGVQGRVMDDMVEIRLPAWMTKLRASGPVQVFYKG